MADSDLFTLTPEQFDRLTSNETDKLRWVKEAVAQFQYYKGKDSGNRPKGDDHNK